VKKKEFTVGRNRCNCHPETCGCDDWAVFTPKGKKWETFYNKENADEIVKLINECPEIANTPE
jgi:hypothetical protein